MRTTLTIAGVAIVVAGCSAAPVADTSPPDSRVAASAPVPHGWTGASRSERWRPQLGYSPRRNWMNDPNGLVHVDGMWHMYYQYNPMGDQWGNMSWGHATSRDLVHWTERPVAIEEWVDGDGARAESIFSGCAVIDRRNVTGLGASDRPPLLAFYTSAYSWVTSQRGRQAQSLAFSLDGGFTFERYEHNPVVAIPPGNRDRLNGNEFRDPKVIWYGPEQKWVMLVVLSEQRRVRFYESRDLVRWTFLSDFGPANSSAGIWEVPDLVELPVEGVPGRTRWVLVLSVNGGTLYGGSGIQYFVGDFDGTTFRAENRWQPGGQDATVVEDFEDGYGEWERWGEAFGDEPATGAPRGADGRVLQPPVQAFEGKHFVNTLQGDDAAVGVALSPPFVIDHEYIQFLVAGGRQLPTIPDRPAPAALSDASSRGETTVNLVVDGRVVRSATGDRTGTLAWTEWDVGDLRGQRARIEIVDLSTSRGGHVLVDHILATDVPLAAPPQRADWVDHGADFYAATTFHGTPEGRALWLGWVSNWLYAGAVPTEGFRGSQSFVRSLSLRQRTSGDGWDLVQTPVGLDSLRLSEDPLRWPAPRQLEDEAVAFAPRFEAGSLLEVELEIEPVDVERVGIDVRFGADDVVRVAYEPREARLVVDRRRSGRVDFSPDFPAVHSAPLDPEGGRVHLRLFVDWSVVTVFGNRGRVTITDQVFPDPTGEITLSPFADGGRARVHALAVWPLRSIWAEP